MPNSQVSTSQAEYFKNVDWYEAHHDEILEQYLGQWVAIMDQQVVGSADDGFELIAKLKADGIRPDKPRNRLPSTVASPFGWGFRTKLHRSRY